jgi:SAM-dependent methyltransferase
MFSATLQNQNLAADDEVSTSDSGFCPSFSGGSSVQSQVQSQVDSYIFENGRRYHSYHAGNYVCPNDERELERLEVYHHIFMLILGGALHTAPLNDPELILDVGAGTGTWCIEMNEKYPDANIIGIDLSHIEYSLPNCTFEVDDAENDWLWPQNHFDYIHFRCMVGAICDWEQFLIRCLECVSPALDSLVISEH